jgi:hypothetical protein
MEFGFNGAGRFFFRNKPAAPVSVLDLDQSNAVVKISAMRSGYDRVLNVAQVSYNNYYAEVDSESEAEPSPTSVERFGRKIVVLDIDDLLFSNNANYAEAIAKLLRNNNYRPRRACRVETRIIPHLELSDVVTISYYDTPQDKNAVFGDKLGGEPGFGDNTSVLVRQMLAKVVGLSTDISSSKMSVELQEVLP